jgi:signal transduction histidine kinase
MLAALGVMTSVALAGGYVITCTLARELRVGRLQSDFVAAVSHEFRTPLTTVRHLSELLARWRAATEGPVSGPASRQARGPSCRSALT